MTINNINNFNQEELKYAYHLSISDSSCSLLDIENVVNQCGNLRNLEIKNNPLPHFPTFVSMLTQLESLSLEMPNIQSLADIVLPNVQYLYLKLEKLQTLRGCLLPKNIRSLTIISSTLKQIEEGDIAHLKHLSDLSIQAPIEQMFSLKNCVSLWRFSLGSSNLDSLFLKNYLPNSLSILTIFGNKLLKTIDLADFSQLNTLSVNNNNPDTKILNIQSCPILREVYLEHTQNLPEGFESCKLLKRLSIVSNKLEEIPPFLTELADLSYLKISNTPLKKRPQDWCKMVSLQILDLSSNQIEDFSFAYSIPNLASLNLNNNPIKDKLFMLEGKKILPIDPFTVGLFPFNRSVYKETLSFMSALAKSGLSRADKEWFFYALKDLETIEITEGWSFYRLIQGLSIPYKLVNDKITRHLLSHDLNKKSLNSFKNGAICFLDGSFNENKNEIKDKLKTLGITVSTNFTEGGTHIIIGSKPKAALTVCGETSFAYLLEHQLYGFIKDVGQEDKFLVQEAAAGESVMVDSLKQLLASTDANMVQIGLEMLKTGGVTEGVFDELLLLNKTFNDAKVRAETKKILISQGSSEWIGVLNDRQTFVDIQNARGKEIRDKLEKMAKSVEKSAVFAFAMLLFKYHQKGLPFVLANFGTNSDERKAALLALTDRTYFDFHTGVGYHNWKNKRPEEVILSPVKTGIAFPIDHPKAKEIRVINMHNCKFDTLSKDITVFENLEELDLSVNNLKSLPIQIGKLTKLKKLDLSFNRLTAFPAALENLSQLEYLDLRHNDANAFKSNLPTAIEVPPSFTKKVPKCVVLL